MTPSPPTRSRGRRIVRAIILTILALLALLLLVIVIAAAFPIRVENPLASSPVAGYADALAQIDAIWDEENETTGFNPVCQSILMTHGQRVERAIVFYHGFTSCPEQFRELGQRFFDLGYNVYVPLAPYHGLTDRFGTALENLTAADLAAHAGAQEVELLPDGTVTVGSRGSAVAAMYFNGQLPTGARLVSVSCGRYQGRPACWVTAEVQSPGYLLPERWITVNAIGYLAHGVTEGDQ